MLTAVLSGEEPSAAWATSPTASPPESWGRFDDNAIIQALSAAARELDEAASEACA
jgi:hypothetical protein